LLKVRGFSSLFPLLHHRKFYLLVAKWCFFYSSGKTKNSTTTAGVAVKIFMKIFVRVSPQRFSREKSLIRCGQRPAHLSRAARASPIALGVASAPQNTQSAHHQHHTRVKATPVRLPAPLSLSRRPKINKYTRQTKRTRKAENKERK
jgi:hypothetical protein